MSQQSEVEAAAHDVALAEAGLAPQEFGKQHAAHGHGWQPVVGHQDLRLFTMHNPARKTVAPFRNAVLMAVPPFLASMT